MTHNNLNDKIVFITGASRGIGREIALKFAQAGAHIVIAAKTSKAHPTLKGTIFSVAEEIEKLGRQALPLQVDVRDELAVVKAVEKVVATFGKIDILVNNASAISLTPTLQTPMKRYDLMMSVNVRGTFLCSQACIPYMKQSDNPHILNMSPPLNMNPKWFANHVAYTMSKYGMSMCTLGMAAELKKQGIAVNSLWPKTTIATAAIEVNFPKNILDGSRVPAIVADAALAIVLSDSKLVTGNFFVDEELLRTKGKTDFSEYALSPGKSLYPDFFLD